MVARVLSDTRILGMVDYQYQPDMNDPVVKLRLAMDNMDGRFKFCSCAVRFVIHCSFSVEALRTYAIPEEKADYIAPSCETAEAHMDIDVNIDPQLMGSTGYQSTFNPPMKSNLRLFPPPLFSRQTIPQGYKFVLFFLSDHCEIISGNQFQVQHCIDGINYC